MHLWKEPLQPPLSASLYLYVPLGYCTCSLMLNLVYIYYILHVHALNTLTGANS